MRISGFLAAIFTGFLSASCFGGMIAKEVQKTPFSNRILLHTGAKVGDKVKYGTFQGENPKMYQAGIRYEIKAMEGDLFVVEYRTWGISFMESHFYRILVRRDGTVERADFWEGGSKVHPLRIASPGLPSYLPPELKAEKLKTPFLIETRAGKFELTEVIHYKSPGLIAEIYLDPKVKFQIVAQFVDMGGQKSGMHLLETN